MKVLSLILCILTITMLMCNLFGQETAPTDSLTGLVIFDTIESTPEWSISYNFDEPKITFRKGELEAVLSFEDSVYYSGNLPMSESARVFFDAIYLMYEDGERQQWERMGRQQELMYRYQAVIDTAYNKTIERLFDWRERP